jgi:glycosyltransferase involved in cell wall biosynthesis
MRVVHVSTTDSGGAAISCRRLHEALLAQGCDSHLLTLDRRAPAISSHHIYNERKPMSFFQKVLYRFGLYTLPHVRKEAALAGKIKGFEHFSFPDSPFRLDQSELIRSADIINLHWTADFLDYKSFFQNVRKPFVWTFHDMNTFTGGCHYSAGCLKFEKVCDVCPQLTGTIDPTISADIQKLKQRSLENASIRIVCPSRWLGKAAERSAILKGKSVQVIPYSLDLNIFRPVSKAEARAKLGLPDDKKILLFVSHSVENKRKGFDLLLECIGNLALPDLLLCSVGSRFEHHGHAQHIALGHISTEEQMMLAYNAADVFVLPSTEDNLPNVVLESLACGVPVLGFRIGGMPDMIRDGFNGYLSDEISAGALGRIVTRIFNEPVASAGEIRKEAEVRYHHKIQAESYLSLYKEILS